MTLSSTAVERAIAQCTSRWAMARGHRLNISIVLAAVHGLSGLFGTVSAVEPSLSRPLSTLSPSLIGHLASVDVKQHESKQGFCPRFQARSKDQEILRREVELDHQAGPKEIMIFRFELFLKSSATDIVLVTLPKHSS